MRFLKVFMANEASILDAFKENQETTVVNTTRKMRIGIIGTGGIAYAIDSAPPESAETCVFHLSDM